MLLILGSSNNLYLKYNNIFKGSFQYMQYGIPSFSVGGPEAHGCWQPAAAAAKCTWEHGPLYKEISFRKAYCRLR